MCRHVLELRILASLFIIWRRRIGFLWWASWKSGVKVEKPLKWSTLRVTNIVWLWLLFTGCRKSSHSARRGRRSRSCGRGRRRTTSYSKSLLWPSLKTSFFGPFFPGPFLYLISLFPGWTSPSSKRLPTSRNGRSWWRSSLHATASSLISTSSSHCHPGNWFLSVQVNQILTQESISAAMGPGALPGRKKAIPS